LRLSSKIRNVSNQPAQQVRRIAATALVIYTALDNEFRIPSIKYPLWWFSRSRSQTGINSSS
jgi:hypothetical protein